MPKSEPLIRNISDTALWAAIYRARENERPDALFRDPFARRLAGARGEQIVREMPFGEKHAWSWVARTHVFDQFILDEIRRGADTVINLAAGLDARPYRLALPPTLTWVEVDLPELLSYKEAAIGSEKPVCRLERVRLDLSDVAGRRELFARLGSQSTKTLILSEGLLIYLSEAEVASLAEDLSRPHSFENWIIDIASPGLLRMMMKKMGPHLGEAGAPFKFGPEAGPDFFTAHGWRAADVRGLLKTAAGLKRLPFFLKLVSLLPESAGRKGSRPWGGVCLLQRS
jgi:methyltransferase (TIGR00027 family)